MKKLLSLIAMLVGLAVPAMAQNVGVSTATYLQTAGVPTQTCSASSYNGVFAISNSLTLYQCSSNNTAGTFQWNVLNGSSSGTSAPSTTFYMSPYAGTTATTFASGANDIRGIAFVPTINVSFSNIFAIAKGADSTGLYSLAIANSSGVLLCHPTTGQNVPAANTVMTFPCSEGQVMLQAGQIYMFLSTGTATTGTLQGVTSESVVFPDVQNFISGCTSASGVLSGTCTIVMSPQTFTIGIAGFSLH
jgi:hypothetical protein